MLLHGAGETVDGNTIEKYDDWGSPVREIGHIAFCSVPGFLLKMKVAKTLKGLCRIAVRKQLVRASPVNLFVTVPQLGGELPSILTEYLLYGMTLDEECVDEGGDDDENVDDDDDNNNGDSADDDDNNNDSDGGDDNDDDDKNADDDYELKLRSSALDLWLFTQGSPYNIIVS